MALVTLAPRATRDAGALVFYRAEATHNLGSGYYELQSGQTPQTATNPSFSYHGVCSAPGTPDFACGSLFAQADLVGGRRVVLRSESRLERRNAGGLAAMELAAATAQIELYTETVTASPVGTAYVQLLVSGFESATASNASLVPGAYHAVTINGVTTSCSPPRCTVQLPSWDAQYLRLWLRTDARVANPQRGVLTGWDAQMIADYHNTLELAAIELYDTNGQRIPDARISVKDASGNLLFDVPTSLDATTTTSTSTPGTSTSVTTSTLPPLGDFRCYPGKTVKGTTRFVPHTVDLVDDVEGKSTIVKAVDSLCNPADGNGNPARLACYEIEDAKGEPSFVPDDVSTSDGFGDLTLRLSRASSLCVASATNGAPSSLPLDHFKCYQSKVAKGAPAFVSRTVTVSDGFETKNVVVSKPLAVCVAVDVDGQGVRRPTDRLVCYAAKDARKQAPFVKRTVMVANQLGALSIEVKKSGRLCLPAPVVPPQ